MNLENYLKENLIKKQQPDFKQIENQLKRAKKDLKTAEANLSIDLTWSFAIAYHAMMRAGKALMFAKGYLPTTRQSHKTIVEFIKMIIGVEYENLANRFNRMRRQRHDFIYDSINNISIIESKASIDTAKKLIDRIVEIVIKEKPARELFD